MKFAIKILTRLNLQANSFTNILMVQWSNDLFGPLIFTNINTKKRLAVTDEASYTTWAHASLLNFYYWPEYAFLD